MPGYTLKLDNEAHKNPYTHTHPIDIHSSSALYLFAELMTKRFNSNDNIIFVAFENRIIQSNYSLFFNFMAVNKFFLSLFSSILTFDSHLLYLMTVFAKMIYKSYCQ